MRFLITGGAGFIGGHTADALLSAGHEVRLLDNLSPPVHQGGKPMYVPPQAELVVGDVRNKADWQKALAGIDVVYHLAAYQDYLADFSTFFHVNTVGTALLYEVAVESRLPLQKVVIASSQAVYGEGKYQRQESGVSVFPNIRPRAQLEAGDWEIQDGNGVLVNQPTDESTVNPQNQYGVSKYTQELVALNLGRRYGIPTTCMRYSIVQGPRQSLHNAYSGACRIFSLCYRFKQQPVVYEDGQQVRDFVNIQDVVRANLLVLGRQADYQAFNVGGGKAYSVLEFARVCAEVFAQPFAPRLTGEFRFGDTRHIHSDISRLCALGWAPRHDPRQSVQAYRDWLETQDAPGGIVESAYERMRKTGVVGSSRST
jgi:dTDP-L-rhamnose 4-epimerase